MTLALQLIIYPAALLIAIIIMRIVESLSLGTLAMKLSLVALVAAVGFGVIRFAFRVDKEDGSIMHRINRTRPQMMSNKPMPAASAHVQHLGGNPIARGL